MKQKFHNGDLVRISKDLGATMKHFTNDCEAIVIGSYDEQYGSGNAETHEYSLHLKGRGHCSWYHEDQLTLIETGRRDLMDEWKAAEEREATEKGDLDWIFSHGDEVLKSAHGATLATLGACLGCDNLWGSRGEGITYYSNAMRILEIAGPFLRIGDRALWDEYCRDRRDNKEKYYETTPTG